MRKQIKNYKFYIIRKKIFLVKFSFHPLIHPQSIFGPKNKGIVFDHASFIQLLRARAMCQHIGLVTEASMAGRSQ
jgi:hypothetical protein